MYGKAWEVFGYTEYDHINEQRIPREDFILVDKYKNNSYNYLFVYWEGIMPAYIKLCIQTIEKHCDKDFIIIPLNEKNIYDYLPDLKRDSPRNNFIRKLKIAHKVDCYRLYLFRNRAPKTNIIIFPQFI